MDQSNRNRELDNVEKAPVSLEEEPNVLNAGQQGAQPIIEDEELYSLEEPYKQDVEIAQEMTVNDFNRPIHSDEQPTEMRSKVQTGFGWAALILSILSFFTMPIIFAAAGIILGFVSKGRGADTLGNASIIIGVVSIVLAIFIAPFV
ncbi:DUF4190 domain-containing protein [Radiobacillus kanasensis]|uniref:DUF4190 domain-containing protein n=1 Tax=Radiobacillus kanasensis TaxID=2844358 RepID=UPI001E2977F1|nr:DUF4190 domain-containing protein [Radiobacillus kanasensis]UFT97796.1 DUF4190 domain-containing protein [Radiobacillus kanasensis]